MKPKSVTNNCTILKFRIEGPSVPVAKKVSVKIGTVIRLYRSILSFVENRWSRVGSEDDQSSRLVVEASVDLAASCVIFQRRESSAGVRTSRCWDVVRLKIVELNGHNCTKDMLCSFKSCC